MGVSEREFDEGMGPDGGIAQETQDLNAIREIARRGMTKKRMGEIALLKLKADLKEDGIKLGGDLKRKIGSDVQKIGISTLEGMVFIEALVREMVDEAFPKK